MIYYVEVLVYIMWTFIFKVHHTHKTSLMHSLDTKNMLYLKQVYEKFKKYSNITKYILPTENLAFDYCWFLGLEEILDLKFIVHWA